MFIQKIQKEILEVGQVQKEISFTILVYNNKHVRNYERESI